MHFGAEVVARPSALLPVIPAMGNCSVRNPLPIPEVMLWLVLIPKGDINPFLVNPPSTAFEVPLGTGTVKSISSGVGRGVLTENFPWLGLLCDSLHPRKARNDCHPVRRLQIIAKQKDQSCLYPASTTELGLMIGKRVIRRFWLGINSFDLFFVLL